MLCALRLAGRCYRGAGWVPHTSLSRLTSCSGLGGGSWKAGCKSLPFRKSTSARRESQMPAFEALLAPGRATAALLHRPQLSAPSIPPDLALWLPIPIPALQLGPKMPPSAKKAAGRGKEMSRDGEPRESPRGEHCPHCTAAPEGSRSPRTVKQPVWVPNVTEELSFLQPNHVGCGLGFLRQSLASSLAAPELVCLVGLVWGTALSPISPPSVGRGAGGQHQAPEQSRHPSSPGSSPQPALSPARPHIGPEHLLMSFWHS